MILAGRVSEKLVSYLVAAPPSLKSWSEDMFRPQTTLWKAAKASRPFVEMFLMKRELFAEVSFLSTSIVIWSERSRIRLETSLKLESEKKNIDL